MFCKYEKSVIENIRIYFRKCSTKNKYVRYVNKQRISIQECIKKKEFLQTALHHAIVFFSQ